MVQTPYTVPCITGLVVSGVPPFVPIVHTPFSIYTAYPPASLVDPFGFEIIVPPVISTIPLSLTLFTGALILDSEYIFPPDNNL